MQSEIKQKAKNFYIEYYSEKFNDDQKARFKEVFFSVNNRKKEFIFSKIKDILDF